jgi:RNA-directed DNA polymerase
MEGVKRYLTKKLKLKVNESKSETVRPKDRKFFGFRFDAVNRLTGALRPKRSALSKIGFGS